MRKDVDQGRDAISGGSVRGDRKGSVMRVCLVGEGTYPVVRGGVSTWCDQLVRGLPEVDFDIIVLTAGRAQAVYDLPPNVRSVSAVDMWGPVPSHKAIRARQRVAFEEAWEIICGHAYGRGGRTPRVTLDAWMMLTRHDIAERLWWLLNDRRSLSILNAIRIRAGLEPSSGRDLASSMAFVARMIMPCAFPPVDADLVHVTSLGSSMLAALPSRGQGVPIVLSEHGVFFRERLMALRAAEWPFLQRNMVAAFLKSMSRIGYEAATSIAPVSEFNGRWAVALGADPAKVVTIHNGVDPVAFRPVADEPDVPTVVFVGRVDPLKDLRTLVLAVPRIVEHVPNVRIRIVGPIPTTNQAYAQSLTALIGELGVGDQVELTGPTTDPVAAYCSGTIAVLSSISEGFPYGALEPMACRRAVVATNVGGIPEVVGDAGLLVRSRDAAGMADACARLLIDRAERRHLAEQGRRRVEQMFTLARMIDQFRDRYAHQGQVRPLGAPAAVVDLRPQLVDAGDRIVPYLPKQRDPEWAYSLIRSRAGG